MTQQSAALDRAQLETARQALSRKREELLHTLGGLQQMPPVREPGDAADVATAEIASDERVGVTSQERALLGDIEHALAKVEAGTYGTSESTGEPIRWERLLALPWARTDVNEALT